MSPGAYYPPGSFYFQLLFAGISTMRDNAFQEASGLSVELEVEDVREGGQAYPHRLPKAIRYSNLVLRRGYVDAKSMLATWVSKSLATDFSKPLVLRDVQLDLLNEEGVPLATWSFRDAWPVKWSMSDFKAQENALAIETLEFAYANFERV